MLTLTSRELVLVLIGLTALLLGYLFYKAPVLVHRREFAHALLFLVTLVLVPLVAVAGLAKNMESATETKFCLSCHEMTDYGKSLHIDDNELLPAVHFQNRLIPEDRACYTCHANYTMFGGVKAKLDGLRHVYVHYLGKVPDKITLYKPFDSSNCLHCHDGMRSFLESKHHRTEKAPLVRVRSGEISCVSAGCHDAGHLVDQLDQQEFWQPPAPEAVP